MSSFAETSFDYAGVIWTCALLPYRIIVCRDAIQYIVQIRNAKAYRNLSYFSKWESIEGQYPQLAMAGLPLNSPEVLSHEVKRRVIEVCQLICLYKKGRAKSIKGGVKVIGGCWVVLPSPR